MADKKEPVKSFADEIAQAVRNGLQEAIKVKFASGYNNPLDDLMKQIVNDAASELKALLVDGIRGDLKDSVFRNDIQTQIRAKLARQLIEKFGGEMEKQVNQLKSDPLTRARITAAIAAIVDERLDK